MRNTISTAASSVASHFPLGVVGLLALVACGPVEVRVSKAQGLKPISGSVSAKFDTSATSTFKCGDNIVAEDNTQTYTVTSRQVSGGCEFSFDQQVTVLGGADYETIKEFKDTARLVTRVEIVVAKLDFYDDQGNRFDAEARIRDMEMWVNGQQVLDVEKIRNLPQTVVLEGEALDVLKRAIKNREACTAHVVARVVVLDSLIKSGVRCDYDSQPTLVLSSASL